MIEIERHGLGSDVLNRNRYLGLVLGDHPDDLADLEAFHVGHELHGDFFGLLVEMLAKGLPVLDGEGLLLTLGHLTHLTLEAIEHHIVTNLEYEGIFGGHLVVNGAVR